MFDSAGIEVLDRAECIRLLGSAPVGRVVFTDQALPAVQPVNFALYDGLVIVRTRPGSKLAAAARNAIMAFEADDFDAELKWGWSVTAVGPASEVTDPTELGTLRDLPLRAWAPGRRDHYIRIRYEVLNGRRIGPKP